MKKRPHFRATITYLATADGGIVSPVSSGFRSQIRFPYHSRHILANQTFLETELVFPGDTVNADIFLVDDNDSLEKIYSGLDFELFANDNALGSGVITHIYTSKH